MGVRVNSLKVSRFAWGLLAFSFFVFVPVQESNAQVISWNNSASGGTDVCYDLAGCRAITAAMWEAAFGGNQYSNCTDNGSWQRGHPYWWFEIIVNCDVNGGGTQNLGGTWHLSAIPPECDGGSVGVPPSCPAVCDNSITGNSFWRPGNSIGGASLCHESSGCTMDVKNKNTVGSSDLVEYTGTASSCTSESPAPPEATEQTQCISSGGNSWCTEDSLADENCGMYNGEYVCLSQIPPGQCTFFGTGKMACESSAGSPPAPDNGTPGVTATPDSTITSDSGGGAVTTNIFNNTTIAASGSGGSGTQQGDAPAEPEQVELDFSEIIEQAPDQVDTSGVDSETTDMGNDQQTFIDGIGDDMGNTATTLGDGIAADLNVSGCSDYNAVFPRGETWSITCADTLKFRDVFAWILRLTLVWGLFLMITRPPES